jgi:hypothetical protein
MDQMGGGVDPSRRIAGIVVTETDDDAKERGNAANVPARAMGRRHEDAFMNQDPAAEGSRITRVRKHVDADVLERIVRIELARATFKGVRRFAEAQAQDHRNNRRPFEERIGLS